MQIAPLDAGPTQMIGYPVRLDARRQRFDRGKMLEVDGIGATDGQRGGNGGSGLVVVGYTTGTMTGVGGVVSTSNGMTLHTFTSSGVFIPSSTTTSPPRVSTYVQWRIQRFDLKPRAEERS